MTYVASLVFFMTTHLVFYTGFLVLSRSALTLSIFLPCFSPSIILHINNQLTSRTQSCRIGFWQSRMDETQGPTVDAVAIAFGALTLITISLRLWARIFVVKSFGPDDYLICIAALFSWAFIGATIASVRYGLGSHFEYVVEHFGESALLKYGQIVWLSSIFYNACLGFIKTSALSLYMRLGDRNLRRLAMIMLGVVSCQAGANVLACIFQCTPISAAWNKPAKYTCIDINAFYLANAAVNIFTDILTYSLPIPLALKLQMPLQQRIGLAVILCLGLFACVSSIIRITYIPQMLVSTDSTWAITGAMYWSVIETNIGILAASIPSWKVLVKRYMPRLLGSSFAYGSGKQGMHGSGFQLPSLSQKSRATSKPLQVGSTDATVEAHSFATRSKKHNFEDDRSSDEEVLFSPGRIGVKTEIHMQID